MTSIFRSANFNDQHKAQSMGGRVLSFPPPGEKLNYRVHKIPLEITTDLLRIIHDLVHMATLNLLNSLTKRIKEDSLEVAAQFEQAQSSTMLKINPKVGF